MANETTRIVIKGRLSYVHLFKPYAAIPGQEEKYSTTILIDKKDIETKEKIDNAIKLAENLGIEKIWNGIKPPKIKMPIHDGDGLKQDGTEYGPECKGHWVINASAKISYPPQVVDRKLQPILDQTEIYSGIYANVAINFYPYAYASNKGIGVGLGNVQKIKDGESLAGTRTASQDFGIVEEEEAW